MPRKAHPGLVPLDQKAAYAAQAMARGEATDSQQQYFLDWLINIAAGTYDEPFDPESQNVTDYRLGRRAVGLAVVKHLNVKIGKLKELETHE